MTDLTHAQAETMQTWAQERDTLLGEISVLASQKEALEIELVTAGLNLDELNKTIQFSKGIIKEFEALEDRTRGSLSVDIAELMVRKSRLEGECFAKELDSDRLSVRNDEKILSMANLSKAHDIMEDQAKIVDSVVGQIIETSKTHLSDVKVIADEIKAVTSEVIKKANKNVEQTNIVLEKLPRYVFELQKPIPIRRAYKAQRNLVIEPEIK